MRDSLLLDPAAVVRSGLCIGCGLCTLDRVGVMALNRAGHFEPVGPARHGASADFAATCPFSPSAANEDLIAAERFRDLPDPSSRLGRVRSAWAGHVADEGLRGMGSSGGMVTWVLLELLRKRWIDGVAHVVPGGKGRLFEYRISRTPGEILAGARSRYYPVELSQVLTTIRREPGRYAVVGVPCFIKGIRLLARRDRLIRERICLTLGLFCGHMKGTMLAESFAWQMGVSAAELAGLDFRHKDPARAANIYTARVELADGSVRMRDWWNMPDGDWGAGFFQNPACNFCDDVVAETADVAFGDAWVEPYSSDRRGTNIVLTRSAAVDGLIRDGIADGRLALEPVTHDLVERTQDAGFRHRREGLAYRLTWHRKGVQPVKRVSPRADGLPLRRKLIYRLRAHIAGASPVVFRVARSLGQAGVYLNWARGILALYQGLAYRRGRWGAVFDRLGLK
ncbi:MAG: Coenzyme F420 hydrogenase/dehydrogenase, beta subunit C-terminal domain [Terrimicrobiaceae bacterium]|nr:Coenzyme F420 hydrogenase/dehydrogenase, beta subunit C-terminal domain [Terrimicrobiaceae bacterium]